jgi:hypothetical protein
MQTFNLSSMLKIACVTTAAIMIANSPANSFNKASTGNINSNKEFSLSLEKKESEKISFFLVQHSSNNKSILQAQSSGYTVANSKTSKTEETVKETVQGNWLYIGIGLGLFIVFIMVVIKR